MKRFSASTIVIVMIVASVSGALAAQFTPPSAAPTSFGQPDIQSSH